MGEGKGSGDCEITGAFFVSLFLEILYQCMMVSERKVVPLQLDCKTALQMGFKK